MLISRFSDPIGSVLSLDSSTLTTSYVGGSNVAAGGTVQLDFEILATFKAGTALTSISFEIEICDTMTGNWLPIQSSRASNGDVKAEHAISAVAGSTVRDRLRTTEHVGAKYVRIASKCAGTVASGDAASATANLTE